MFGGRRTEVGAAGAGRAAEESRGWPGGGGGGGAAICTTPPPGGLAAHRLREAAGPRRQLPSVSKSRADPDNPCTTLTPRGRGALRSQSSRAHKRSPQSFQLEPAKKSATSALRCRHHKAKTLTFCLLFIQLLRL